MPPDAVDISIIIVTHNSLATIEDCLGSIPGACNGSTFEIIVVDNCSNDGTVDQISTLCSDVRMLVQENNLGFGRACNLAVQAASGEYLLLVNPDAVLDPTSVTRLKEAHRANDRIGFAVPRLRFPDGRFQPGCRKFPTTTNMIFSRGSSVARLVGIGSEQSRYTLPDYPDITAVPAVAGTVALILRSDFDRVGGFDPRFFLYMEDTDLCLRLNHNGYKNLFVPTAGAVHRWGRGSAAGKLRRVWRHHLSVWKYFLKHYPNGFSVVVLPALLLVNGLVSAVLPDRRAEL